MGKQGATRTIFVPGVMGIVVVLSAVLSAVGFAVISPTAQSTPEYSSQFNSQYGTRGSKLDGCQTCHTSPGGGAENVNPYGQDFAKNNHDFAAVEGLDSDGDGFSNIDEIKARTYPGDPNDNPNSTKAKEAPPGPPPSSTTTTTAGPLDVITDLLGQK
jgi:hypothetical protein